MTQTPRGEAEERIEAALRRTFFAHQAASYFESASGQKDLEDHVRARYELCRDRILPWIARHQALREARVLEIGCGTGSSTAAFAEHCAHVSAYDINPSAVSAARERLSITGCHNVDFFVEPVGWEAELLEERHPGDLEIVLLYAVLEHQTLEERLATLRVCWKLLRPGGLLIVTDTPNRLCYRHYHTSEIPFFDMLPEALAWNEIPKSPRAHFRTGMAQALEASPERARDVLARWGTGVSFHEFEATLGDLTGLVVGDGFDREILERKSLRYEEELLLIFLRRAGLPVPPGFCRLSLDLIFQKPGGESNSPPARAGEEVASQLDKGFHQLHAKVVQKKRAPR